MSVPVSRYSYLLFFSLLVINRSFVLFIVRLFALFNFISARYYRCSKEKELFWSWTVFRYFDPATCSTPSSRVNKHHTADSTDFVLVQEAKEPITIIDKRDRRNQYSPYINLSRGRDIKSMYFKKCQSQAFSGRFYNLLSWHWMQIFYIINLTTVAVA